MKLAKKRRAEAREALECAMCVGNRQLLEQIQQDVARLAAVAAPERAVYGSTPTGWRCPHAGCPGRHANRLEVCC